MDEGVKASVPGITAIRDISVLSTSDINVCYDGKSTSAIAVELMNVGTDTIFHLQLGWFYASDQTGSVSWSGAIAPNATQVVSLTNLSFLTNGDFSVTLWAKSGTADANSANDSISVNVHVYQPFHVNVLTDTTVCKNTNLQVSLPTGYNSYQWSNGSSSSSTIINSNGNYVVTVTDVNGCATVDSMALQSFASPSSLLPGDTILCDGVILSPVIESGYVQYDWSKGDSGNTISIDQEGYYSLTVTDTMGCTYSDTMNVQYKALPNPSTPTQVSICNGDSAVINATGNFSSYIWSNGATTSSITIASPGIYFVTVTGSTGCLGFDTVQVLVNPLPSINFNDSVMCNFDPIVMDIGWYETYSWSNGDSTQNPLIDTPGLYFVTVTDQNGCESIDSIDVVNLNVSVSLGADTTICSGDGAYIVLGVYDSYQWNDGSHGSVLRIGAAGVYSVTVSQGACIVSDEIIVYELAYPVASFSEIVTSPDVQFTNLSNVNTTLTWDFGDLTSSSAVNPFHTYANAGIYDVNLEVRNMCDTVNYSKRISIFPQASANIYANENLSIFPTLTTEFVNFKIDGINTQEIHYSVYDVTGKLLKTAETNYYGPDYIYQVNVSSYASGTYYLRISNNNSMIVVKPFVKE
jgi:hypothetical protein